jgi:thioesterase domain-containing protein
MIVLQPRAGEGRTMMRLRQACSREIDMTSVMYPDITELIDPDYSFEKLLQDVVRQIEHIEPVGPIMLTAYSWGGIIAYMAAVELIDAGRTVSFLGLFDTDWSPTACQAPPQKNLVRLLVRKLRSLTKVNVIAKHSARFLSRYRTKAFMRALVGWSEKTTRFEIFRHLFRHHMTEELLTALSLPSWNRLRKFPRVIDVPVFLFRAELRGSEAADDLGWGAHCVDLQIIRVPGNHSSMLEPENASQVYSEYLAAVSLTEMPDHALLSSERSQLR